MRWFLMGVSIFSIMACNINAEESAHKNKKDKIMSPDILEGLSYKDIVKIYGTPKETIWLTSEELMDEFRYSVHEKLKEKGLSKVKECIFNKEDGMLYIWFVEEHNSEIVMSWQFVEQGTLY